MALNLAHTERQRLSSNDTNSAKPARRKSAQAGKLRQSNLAGMLSFKIIPAKLFYLFTFDTCLLRSGLASRQADLSSDASGVALFTAVLRYASSPLIQSSRGGEKTS
jgi:hypothetical protein